MMDFPKSCFSLDSIERQNYTCYCGRAGFALLFPPHILSKLSLFQPSPHDESCAPLLSSTVPELRGSVQGPSHCVPMGTCRELEERAEQLSKPQLFLPWPVIPLELQVLGGGSSKLLLKGDFVADFRAVL